MSARASLSMYTRLQLRDALVVSVLIASIAVGCAGVQNLTVTDVRIPRHFYKSFTIAKTLPEISKALYQYNTTCRPVAELAIDPTDPTVAHITISTVGWTKMSIIVVMDFKEDSLRHATDVTAYTYYTTWQKFVRQIVGAIENPTECG